MTDNFIKAFQSATGSCAITCECGRTHYNCDVPGDFDPGEFEQLEQRNCDYPERYFRHCGSFEILDLFGREVIADCPCKKAEAFEKLLLTYQSAVLKYYRGVKQQKEKELEALKVLDDM